MAKRKNGFDQRHHQNGGKGVGECKHSQSCILRVRFGFLNTVAEANLSMIVKGNMHSLYNIYSCSSACGIDLRLPSSVFLVISPYNFRLKRQYNQSAVIFFADTSALVRRIRRIYTGSIQLTSPFLNMPV